MTDSIIKLGKYCGFRRGVLMAVMFSYIQHGLRPMQKITRIFLAFSKKNSYLQWDLNTHPFEWQTCMLPLNYRADNEKKSNFAENLDGYYITIEGSSEAAAFKKSWSSCPRNPLYSKTPKMTDFQSGQNPVICENSHF